MSDLTDFIEKYKTEFISPYCIKDCPTSCCDFGDGLFNALHFSEENEEALFNGLNIFDFQENLRNVDGVRTFVNSVCPQYSKEESVCKVYDLERPNSCKSFPYYSEIGDDGGVKGIVLHANCPFILENYDDIVVALIKSGLDEISEVYDKIRMVIPVGGIRSPSYENFYFFKKR